MLPTKWELADPQVQKLIYFLLIGLIGGWLAGKLVGGGGLLRNLFVGVIGAVVGGFLLQALNISLGLNAKLGVAASVPLDQIATATIGAVVIVLIARFIAR